MAADTQYTAAEPVSGSSFYAAMRILPRTQREAMYGIYRFCRQVDDIADSQGPRAGRLAELEKWRADIDALFEGRTNPSLARLAEAVRRFGLAREDFLAIIDGMEMDVVEEIRAPAQAILDLYCDRVACAVGRLSVRVFGLERETGERLAHHLGRALQLTNILRDLDEDAAMGRLYLPREALDNAGIRSSEPGAVLRSPNLAIACTQLIERARTHFAEAERIMAGCPRRMVRAPRIMGAVYRVILDALVERGWAPPRAPVHLPRTRLVWILLRFAIV